MILTTAVIRVIPNKRDMTVHVGRSFPGTRGIKNRGPESEILALLIVHDSTKYRFYTRGRKRMIGQEDTPATKADTPTPCASTFTLESSNKHTSVLSNVHHADKQLQPPPLRSLQFRGFNDCIFCPPHACRLGG